MVLARYVESIVGEPLYSLFTHPQVSFNAVHTGRPLSPYPTPTDIASSIADYNNYDEADEETQKHLEKEFAEAEKHGWAEGKPGSFLNRLISHGNKKTEEELKASAGSGSSSSGS